MSARSDGKVVFKLLLIAIAYEIDAGIEGVDLNFGAGWDADAPFGRVIAGNIVDFGSQVFDAVDRRVRACAEELEVNGVCPRARRSRNGGTGRLPHYSCSIAGLA